MKQPRAFAIALLLLTTILGRASAQPPPPPACSTWILQGGAIGENATVAINSGFAQVDNFAIAMSLGLHPTPRFPQIAFPIRVLAAGPFGPSHRGTKKVSLPPAPGLIGLSVFVQGVITSGSNWWPSPVCHWVISPPSSREFRPVSPLLSFPLLPGDGHARATLQDGNVLITGGLEPSLPGPYFRFYAWVYDPSKGAATTVHSMSTQRGGHVMRGLGDGTVLVVGGDQNPSTPTAELYDPKTRKFQSLGPVPYFIREPTATVITWPGTGREFVLVAGGSETIQGQPSSRAMLYDATRRTFVALPPLARPRHHAAAMALAVGTVLITGGTGAGGVVHDDAELFALATGRFHPWGRMTRPRTEHAAVSIDPVRVLLIAGRDRRGVLKDIEVFDARYKHAFPLPHELRIPRARFRPVVLADGSILIAGGSNDSAAEPGRVPELLTDGGVTLLRPIHEWYERVAIQPLAGGGALAIGHYTTHHLE
jgi:hypothetical protein